jgi:murein DD-endopeptidase MepM/ murein hydrolase activator NlpD
MIAESVRELFGPGKVLGNHVVIEIDDGVYAVLAHLRKSSLTVEAGDLVGAGTRIGACGNSGNSTEPHLHFQLMDHRRVLFAAGLPARFTCFRRNGSNEAGMPRTGQLISTPVR